MQLSALTFYHQFLRFKDQIQTRSGDPFTSFRDGLSAEWEDYKGELRQEALRRLATDKWKRKDIGTGKILKRVISAIEIDEPAPTKLRNNLVSWQNRYDIHSCEVDGTPRHIEVKAARRAGGKLSFFVTRNEWDKSRALKNYHFYLVLNAKGKRPRVLEIDASNLSADFLEPTNYLAAIAVPGRN